MGRLSFGKRDGLRTCQPNCAGNRFSNHRGDNNYWELQPKLLPVQHLEARSCMSATRVMLVSFLKLPAVAERSASGPAEAGASQKLRDSHGVKICKGSSTVHALRLAVWSCV